MLGSRIQGLVRMKVNPPLQAVQLIQQIYIAATHTQQLLFCAQHGESLVRI
jgi:hypothetical protein